MSNKYNKKLVREIIKEGVHTKPIAIAREYSIRAGIEYTENVRKHINNIIKRTDFGETNQYEGPDLSGVISARKPNGKIMQPKEFCETYGLEYDEMKSYKLITHLKEPVYNIASHTINGEEANLMEQFAKQLLEEISDIPSKPSKINRKNFSGTDYHLLVIDPADIHIGKLAMAFETGEDYDAQIAIQRVEEGVEGILDKASGFKINKILFVAGNDVLHIDNPKRTTTSGTPQDTDGQWYSNFLLAKELYIRILSRLVKIADVHVVYNPSNHDYMTGFFLADVVRTYFLNCTNITFDSDLKHRKYFTYGRNLIGTSHGDGAKTTDLALLMAHEAPDSWAKTTRRYFYTHHVHHKTSKDFMSVTVESLRSPSGTDGWHHRNGYQHAPKAIEGYIHHPTHGQVSRLTHYF